MSTPSPRAPAEPAPLGLAAFGTATFMLSFFYVGVDPDLTPAVFPLAFFFGGVVQLIAGAAEFRQGSTFGATAFCSYGAFWMAYALYGRFVVDTLPADEAHVATGLFILPWAVLTLYLTVATLRTTGALLALFTSATITFTLLALAQFVQSSAVTRVGGAFGFATAALAWYASFAGLVNSTWGRQLIPTMPDPGARLGHLGHKRARPVSLTSSIGEREQRTDQAA
ncbi:acetate uptake transporter [Streptomyces olivaceoviridis]|uniref:acetate uptake transporter n=1 Tax=Streptomyces olivaceoviridis TaxID=1921 RepID=UPI003332CE56